MVWLAGERAEAVRELYRQLGTWRQVGEALGIAPQVALRLASREVPGPVSTDPDVPQFKVTGARHKRQPEVQS